MRNDLSATLFEFIRSHQLWTAPVLFALAFGESIAFLSFFIPAWALIVAVGALSGADAVPFWPALTGTTLGAAFGDWFSYWIGTAFRDRIAQIWPFKNHPKMLPRAEAFVRKWGTLGIFVGRFFGPLRATVPLAAGLLRLPYWPFQLANFGSALVWSAVLLNFGRLGVTLSVWLSGS